MNETVIKYQCPTCGAPLRFDSTKQKIVCDSCDSEYEQDYFKDADEDADLPEGEEKVQIDWKVEGVVNKQEVMEDQPGFICTSCGAEIVSDGNTVATECMYCNNPVVMTGNVSGMVKPDMVIPFKINEEQAKNMLKDFYKGKRLLPTAFKNKVKLSDISGMYVPFWLFSCTGEGDVRFSATKMRTWSDSNYKYTNTKYYKITRVGSVGFELIPVDASTKMEDNYMDGLEPYNYNDLVDFDSLYMAGYFADKFDVGVAESGERASGRVVQSVIDTFRNTVHGYTTVHKSTANVQMTGEDIRYVLLPVWMLNMKYEGKMYQFAINGQTGKVSGALPIDKLKQKLYFLATLLGSAAVLTPIISWIMQA